MRIFATNDSSTAGGSTNSFATMQPISGTSPAASSPTDTLTFTSSDNSISIVGDSGTDTLDFTVVGLGGFTEGSVLFASAGGTITEDNANFFWDDTNDALVIGQNTASITVNSFPVISRLTVDMSGDFIGTLVHQHTNVAAFASNIILSKSRGTHASPTIVASGDTLGIYGAYGYSGNAGVGYLKAAQIEISVGTGTPSTTSMPGRITLKTTADGAVSPTEAVTIFANQTVQFDAYSTGIAHLDSNGLITSSAVNLASSDVTGTLPEANGGTNQSTYTTGDILYASASNTLSKLAATTNGFVLTLAAGVPTWAASASGITRSINSISTNQTLGSSASTDYVYFVSGTTTVTMPTAVSNTNRYTIKNVGVATVTIDFTGVETGDGSTTLDLTPNTSLDLISDNTNYRIV